MLVGADLSTVRATTSVALVSDKLFFALTAPTRDNYTYPSSFGDFSRLSSRRTRFGRTSQADSLFSFSFSFPSPSSRPPSLDSYSPASTDDIPPLTDLLTLSTYLLPLLQQAHRSALVSIFREFLAESYFHPTGPIVNVARAQLKYSQLQQEIDLQVLSEGRGWNVPGSTDADLNKNLRKAWSKHLSTAETNGSFKRTVAEEMKNSLGKIVTGKDSFGGLESGMPMNSLLQVS